MKEIVHEGFVLRLLALPLHDLFPHEEVIEKEVSSLSASMKDEGIQRDPVIADIETHVILDGMHRYHALKRIGAKFCLACLVDYRDERVKVSRWLRVLNDSRFARQVAKELGLEEEVDVEEALRNVDKGSTQGTLITGKSGFISIDSEGIEYPKVLVRAFDHAISKLRLSVALVTDDDIIGLLKQGSSFLYVRKPTKGEVVNSARIPELFPPKSTRHILPARPLAVRFPIEYLKLDDEGEVNTYLSRHMEKLTFRKLSPGSYFQGRVYSETIYVSE